jgi:hypothetical protein
LAAAASQFGRYTTEEPFGGIAMAKDTTTMAWQSDVVIIGRVLDAKAFLSADQRHISTEYRIQPERVLKPNAQPAPSGPINVSLPGGEIVFEDGSTATTHARNLRRQIEVGKEYLFFLQELTQPVTEALRARLASATRYRVALGTQGFFELRAGSEGTTLESYGNPNEPVAQELAPLRSTEQVLAKVSNAVREADLLPAREKKPTALEHP